MMQIRPSSRDSSNIHKTCEAKVEALNALVTSLRRENAALREAYSSNNMNGHSSGRSSLFFGCFGAGTSSGGHDSSDREELMQELESLKDELDTYRKKLDINTGLSVKIPQGSVKFVQPNRSKSLSKVSIGDLHDDGEGNTVSHSFRCQINNESLYPYPFYLRTFSTRSWPKMGRKSRSAPSYCSRSSHPWTASQRKYDPLTAE